MTRHTSFVAVLALLLAAVAVVSGASTARNDSAQKPEHKNSLFKRLSDRAAVRRSALKKKATSPVASSSSSSPVTAEFTSDRRGLASADSFTCLDMQEILDMDDYDCYPSPYTEAMCNAKPKCAWTVVDSSSSGTCDRKYATPAQKATHESGEKKYTDLERTCSPIPYGNTSCPTDKCEKPEGICTVKQSAWNDAYPADPIMAEYHGKESKCNSHAKSGTCEADSDCYWYGWESMGATGTAGYCYATPKVDFEVLKPAIKACGLAGTPVGSKSGAQHVASHDMCPLKLAQIKCRQITSASECTKAKTSNTCEWTAPETAKLNNDPEAVIFPCQATEEQRKTYESFLTQDLITLMDLSTTCSPYNSWSKCSTQADCEWENDQYEGYCTPTDAKIGSVYAAHPHMEKIGKAHSTCSKLDEKTCATTTGTCVWAPPAGTAAGECISTVLNLASHFACNCPAVKTTFPSLTLDPSVCIASSTSPAAKTVVGFVGIIVALVALLFA